MNLQITFTDGNVSIFPIANKKEADNTKPYLDSTVLSAKVVKGDQVLNWLKK